MKRFLFSVVVFFLCGGPVLVSAARAHPHVWIEARVDVKFDAQSLAQSMMVTWTFDELYSLFAIEGLDTNEDGVLSPDEVRPLAENSLTELESWSYFTYAKSSGDTVQFSTPEDFGASYENGYLKMFFDLKFATPLNLAAADLQFKTYDPTYYIAIDLARETPVSLSEGAPASCSASVGDILEQPLSQSLFESDFDDPERAQSLAESFASPVKISCTETATND